MIVLARLTASFVELQPNEETSNELQDQYWDPSRTEEELWLGAGTGRKRGGYSQE